MTQNLVLTNNNSTLKNAIWVYMILWLVEGGLRRWVFPSLATPLLVVRDPVAIYIILQSLKQRIYFLNPFVVSAYLVTILSLSLTLILGHQNLYVGLYGARIMLLHFPLIFIMGKVLKTADIEQLGRVLLLLCPLMTVLIALQFNSPQDAWVNRGIGGSLEGAGFSGAMGYFRPPGTWTFTGGPSSFYPLVAVYVFYFALTPAQIKPWLLWTAAVSLIIALPMTISRTAVFWTLLVGVTAVFAASIQGNKKVVLRLFGASVVFGFIVFFLKGNALFEVASEVFLSRVDAANQGGTLKESMGLRMLESLIGPLDQLQKLPLLDGRLGMGTNAGAALLQKSGFLISEGELGRLFGERGLVLGFLVYAVRAILTIKLGFAAFKALRKQNLLPCLLFVLVFFTLYNGQWAQPTALGFAVVVTALMIVSLKNRTELR